MAENPLVPLVGGLAVLLGGAELLVRSSTRLAILLRISPLLVGLTVVAFGTSAPELAVSVTSGVRGASDLAAGNVVGSNIFNVLFILGVSALLRPLDVSSESVRRDAPTLVVVSAALWLLMQDGTVHALDAGLLLGGMLAYLVWSVLRGRRDRSTRGIEAAGASGVDVSILPSVPADATGYGSRDGARPGLRLGLLLVTAAAGLALLILGSRWLVAGAVGLARVAGVGDAVIGLTVVAAGTSLPEVATSVVATLRGERDLAVGNVLGSNVFNSLAIIGAAALAGGGELAVSAQLRGFDLPVMVGASVACLPIFLTGHRIDRWEGGLLLLFYMGYTAALVGSSLGALVLPRGLAVWGFLAPLTLLAVVAVARARRGPGGGSPVTGSD